MPIRPTATASNTMAPETRAIEPAAVPTPGPITARFAKAPTRMPIAIPIAYSPLPRVLRFIFPKARTAPARTTIAPDIRTIPNAALFNMP